MSNESLLESPSSASLLALLRERFAKAISTVVGSIVGPENAAVRVSADPKFGDYQCNAAMGLARSLKANPRQLAEKIAAAAAPLLADVIEPLEIAGPGFINIRLRDSFLAARLNGIGPAPAAGEDRFGIAPVATPQTVVVDYSSPNIAKQMHVGHLRSTIIGDALARVLAFDGHTVIRQNHVGDWGTQFGMLIRHYSAAPFPQAGDHDTVLSAIEDDYRTANAQFKEDPAYADAARLAVGRLQSGDAAAREVWRRVCEASAAAFRDIYARLAVLLTDADIRGESFYNDRLAPTVALLRKTLPPRAAGAAAAGPWAEVREDEGAVCVFMYGRDGKPLFKGAEEAALPLIIQKKDGAFLYASTDLAGIRFRVDELHATRVLYVVGAPTRLHLEMVFAAARLAGWLDHDVSLEHVSFGQVLGDDGKLLRTRSGGAVKLRELLDEAESRAAALLEKKLAAESTEYRATFSMDEKRMIARRVGIGAVKYFDLARDRNADYVFDWDTILAMQGNTAPYMLYAYTRVRSIARKAAERSASGGAAPAAPIAIAQPAERALALRLVRLHEVIDAVAADLLPHVLCTFLYDLAGDLNRFYEACPVLDAQVAATRSSRLQLCELAGRALRLGLHLLGIDVVERM